MRDEERALMNARRAIADAVLGPTASTSASLGNVTLRRHQQRAVTQLLRLIAKNKGAMLADRVGTGKTYVALAIARRFAPTLVITPATLRVMWENAAARAHVSISVMSYDALSRGKRPVASAELVIFDEAHRLRHGGTRRYAMAANVSRHARVLLLSATPVQNRVSDLGTELALFLGRAARTMSDDELAEYVVRDEESDGGALPRMDGPYELSPPSDDGVPGDLIALPPPVPASDEGMANALLAIGLLHQWTSSQSALVTALRRRRSRGLGLVAALDAGRYPSRSELSAWTGGDTELQLVFPEVASANVADDVDSRRLSTQVHRHCEAIARLLERLQAKPTADLERVNLLRDIRRRHPGEKILAFAQYAETVDGLFRLLAQDGRVAALTARGARIASGRVKRADILSQFMPGPPSHTKPMPVDLLLSTDVLSEGLNLQEASIVVHLDLPWNPARLDQRVGRVRRFGSRHARIVVYLIQPSHAAEQLLAIEKRLRAKVRTAQRSVGLAGRILPPTGRDLARPIPGAAESIGHLRTILHTWRAGPDGEASLPAIAAVRARRPGFLAAVRSSDGSRLLAGAGGVVRTDIDALIRAAHHASGRAMICDGDLLDRAKQLVEEWIDRDHARAALDLRPTSTARNRRQALARISHVLAKTPRHRRPALAPLAAAARQVATATLSEGLERALDEILLAELPNEAWLQSLVELGESHAKVVSAAMEPGAPELIALIVFQ